MTETAAPYAVACRAPDPLTPSPPAVIPLGPATLTITDTALIVAVGPSRLILTAEGITLDAPRIDLNPDECDSA